MAISVACPHCGSVLRAPDNAAGRTAPCPRCKTHVTVPAKPRPGGGVDLGATASRPTPWWDSPEEIAEEPAEWTRQNSGALQGPVIVPDLTEREPVRPHCRGALPYGTAVRPRRGVAGVIVGVVATLLVAALLVGVIWYALLPAKESDSLARAVDGRAEKERAAANEAVKALGKIQAATQVGVNYSHYGELVADAKASVNESLRVLPAGTLADHIKSAMDAYQDAGDVWGLCIRWNHFDVAVSDNTELVRKYNLGDLVEESKQNPDRELSRICMNMALSRIWKFADSSLTAVRADLDRH